MTVEFIGMISTRDQSETRRSRGRHRPRLRAPFRPRPRGRRLRPRADRLRLVPAGRHPGGRVCREPHRPARLPDRAPSRVRGADAGGPHVRDPGPVLRRPDRRARHHRRQRRRAAPRRRLPAQGRALRPHRRVPRHPQAGVDLGRAVQLRGPVLPDRGLPTPRSARRSSRGSRCTSAAPRSRPTGSAASTRTSTPCGASRWPRPPSRSPRSGRPPRPPAGPKRPGSASRSGPSSARPRSWPGNGPTRSSPPPRRTSPSPAASGAGRLGVGGAQPENAGSQRLLAAAAKGELHDRALWTPLAAATGAAGNSTALVGTPDTVAQALLDYVDIGVTTILLTRLRPVRRRHRLRPVPAPARPGGSRPP